MVFPSGLTSNDIQVPSLVLIATRLATSKGKSFFFLDLSSFTVSAFSSFLGSCACSCNVPIKNSAPSKLYSFFMWGVGFILIKGDLTNQYSKGFRISMGGEKEGKPEPNFRLPKLDW